VLELAPLPADFAVTRDGLAQIVTHVMARRRDAATGRFGMRLGPGSIASPMFADEVLRLNATTLLRERRVGDRPETKSIANSGVTLAELAAFAEVDLDASFSVGTDTPPLADVAAPLRIDQGSAAIIITWFGVAAELLDEVIASRPAADASAVQLWPEHFDLAVDMLAGRGRTNLGASPGDSYCDEPYLYVGPWDARRPGDAAFWNAPFGAVLRYAQVAAADEPREAMRSFLMHGLVLLDAHPQPADD
jgi:hypothetical protein